MSPPGSVDPFDKQVQRMLAGAFAAPTEGGLQQIPIGFADLLDLLYTLIRIPSIFYIIRIHLFSAPSIHYYSYYDLGLFCSLAVSSIPIGALPSRERDT